MRVRKAVITAAGASQRALPLQTLVHEGAEKSVLGLLIQQILTANIREIGVVVWPGDEARYTQAAGNLAGAVRFIPQQEARGYGHAIYCAREFVGDEPFLHMVGDHLYVSAAKTGVHQLLALAELESCSASGVQPTRENLLPRFGAVAGRRIPGRQGVYRVETVIEKPTPTEAEQKLMVPGIRAGYYLCFFGIHVLTPTVMDLLGRMLADHGNGAIPYDYTRSWAPFRPKMTVADSLVSQPFDDLPTQSRGRWAADCLIGMRKNKCEKTNLTATANEAYKSCRVVFSAINWRGDASFSERSQASSATPVNCEGNGRGSMEESRENSRSFAPCWRSACALCAFFALAVVSAGAQTFTSLHSFCSQTNCPDGSLPVAGLVQGTDGHLYGTTVGGGAALHGTVFRIGPGGKLARIYSFCSLNGCADGAGAVAGLVQGTDGNLYGTTDLGGNTTGLCQASGGCGTVFKVSQAGTLTTLVSFDWADGAVPLAPLIEGIDGNFYGTTYEGGAYGPGTAFETSSAGTLSTLYSFCKSFTCGGGGNPKVGLLQGTNGNFYGMTTDGGNGSCESGPVDGCGTVFELTPGGYESVLYNFSVLGDCGSCEPWSLGALIQATDGNFYGTSLGGGANGYGAVLKMTPAGVVTTLYSFCSQGNCADGAYPYAGLIQATDGHLYGTTEAGGAYYSGGYSGGTIFRLTLSGTLTTLHSFCSQPNCADGSEPTAGLVQDTNGKFYGTTSQGGTTGGACGFPGCGTIFSLSMGLDQFVEPEPRSGTVGSAVNVLGTALMGATSVTFNGTPATFTVSSRSLITATVPAGATTGEIEVTTPHGVLRSNFPFRVLP